MGNIYKDYTPPSAGGGVYFKPEDGVPTKFRIVSEPVIFDSEYQGNVSTRYAWIMWNFDQKTAQVVVVPVTAYRMIAELGGDDDWGDPTENPYNIKVTRRGTGKETKWSVVPQPAKETLTEDEQNEIKGINLVSMIEASPSASKVQWLRDVIANGRSSQETSKRDTVVEDIPDEPINLDDIPF